MLCFRVRALVLALNLIPGQSCTLAPTIHPIITLTPSSQHPSTNTSTSRTFHRTHVQTRSKRHSIELVELYRLVGRVCPCVLPVSCIFCFCVLRVCLTPLHLPRHHITKIQKIATNSKHGQIHVCCIPLCSSRDFALNGVYIVCFCRAVFAKFVFFCFWCCVRQ